MSLDEELREAQQCYQQHDFKCAYEKYLALGKGGHGDSQVFLGWMIQNGIGTQVDPTGASLWFKRAALLGSIQGAFYYGRYLTTQGQHKDALKWYRIAADKGDVSSIFRVGYSLVRGKGIETDIPLGYKYLLKAADSGHIFSLREIGILDLKGNRGLIHRVTGFWLLLYAVCSGILISLFNRNSDRLRR